MLKIKQMIINWLFGQGKDIILNEIKHIVANKTNHTCNCKKEVVLEIVEGIENIYTEAYESPACFDIKANEHIILHARSKVAVKTGITANIPTGYWIKLHSRSGLSARNSIEVGAGVLDEDFKGEWQVILYNHSDNDFEIEAGSRIAQFELKEKQPFTIKQGNKLKESIRGANGFGSSGVK